MTVVGFGQQGSQAVGSGFESQLCRNFLWHITNIFRYPKLSEALNDSPTKFFGTVRQKHFDGKS